MTSKELRTYPHGVPCWVQLETDDTERAADFYRSLFGWSFADGDPRDPGSYLFAGLDGRDVGAITRQPGVARWISFIACDDVDQTCDAIVEAGGTILEPPKPGTPFGRSATCADPQGSEFELWQAGMHPGSQIVNEPGAWNFSDLHTPDAQASLAFYSAVFGWRVDPDLGAGMIRLLGYGDHVAATVDPDIRERQKFAPEGFADVIAGLTDDSTAGWTMRFTVTDRDASARAVEQFGGVVESAANTMWTREAVVRDPAGAQLVLSQFASAS